jgi:hypothetical protein
MRDAPGPAFNCGTASVGNSNENNEMPGPKGAGAIATTRSGHGASRWGELTKPPVIQTCSQNRPILGGLNRREVLKCAQARAT